MNVYILASLFWVGYFFLHSLLAADFVKARFPAQGYRLFYSIVSTLLLLLIGYFLSINQTGHFFTENAITKFVALVLTAYGVMVIRMSFRQYSLGAFLGLRNETGEAFTDKGILSKVRHPLYSGTILICLGFVLYIPSWLNALSVAWVFAYLPIGIWLEEKKLIKKYGRSYNEYRSKVPAIIPKLF